MPEIKLQNPYIDELEVISKTIIDPFSMHRAPWVRGKQYPYYGYLNGNEQSKLTVVRDDLVKKFSWAIPNDEAVATIVKYSPIIEIGAGTGYWASLIKQAGGDILAFDKEPHTNAWCGGSIHTEVLKGGPTQIAFHPGRTLFLCWPPYQNEMAEQCLKFFKGDILIYVGESNGCTATDQFEERLADQFIETESVDIPQYSGIHDYLRVFERRVQPK